MDLILGLCVGAMEGGVPENLSKQLAVAVRSIQWSYAIFWSLSARQQGYASPFFLPHFLYSEPLITFAFFVFVFLHGFVYILWNLT